MHYLHTSTHEAYTEFVNYLALKGYKTSHLKWGNYKKQTCFSLTKTHVSSHNHYELSKDPQNKLVPLDKEYTVSYYGMKTGYSHTKHLPLSVGHYYDFLIRGSMYVDYYLKVKLTDEVLKQHNGDVYMMIVERLPDSAMYYLLQKDLVLTPHLPRMTDRYINKS